MPMQEPHTSYRARRAVVLATDPDDPEAYRDSLRRPSMQIEQVRANLDRARRFFEAAVANRVEDVLGFYGQDARIDHSALGVIRGGDIVRYWRTLMAGGADRACRYEIEIGSPTGAEVSWRVRFPAPESGGCVDVETCTRLVFDRGAIKRQIDQVDERRFASELIGRAGWLLVRLPGTGWIARNEARRLFGMEPLRDA